MKSKVYFWVWFLGDDSLSIRANHRLFQRPAMFSGVLEVFWKGERMGKVPLEPLESMVLPRRSSPRSSI